MTPWPCFPRTFVFSPAWISLPDGEGTRLSNRISFLPDGNGRSDEQGNEEMTCVLNVLLDILAHGILLSH
jgi:hypothetical protein